MVVDFNEMVKALTIPFGVECIFSSLWIRAELKHFGIFSTFLCTRFCLSTIHFCVLYMVCTCTTNTITMENEMKCNAAKTLICWQTNTIGDKKVSCERNIYLPMLRNVLLKSLNLNGGNSPITTQLWRSYKCARAERKGCALAHTRELNYFVDRMA